MVKINQKVDSLQPLARGYVYHKQPHEHLLKIIPPDQLEYSQIRIVTKFDGLNMYH